MHLATVSNRVGQERDIPSCCRQRVPSHYQLAFSSDARGYARRRAGKERAMRVIVIGATGNVGTSVLRSLENEDQIESILGLARRLPRLQMRKVEWTAADVTKDDLVSHLRGVDAAVLLAWLKQPSRDLDKLWMNNVEGSMRAADAVKEAGVPVLLYASSIGTYSPAPKDRTVDESWPVEGIPTLYYSRQKA